MPTLPDWWDWELEISSHARKRMEQRGLSEIELRIMMSSGIALERDVMPGRWTVLARLRGKRWKVIVEPDCDGQWLVVITAFPVEP